MVRGVTPEKKICVVNVTRLDGSELNGNRMPHSFGPFGDGCARWWLLCHERPHCHGWLPPLMATLSLVVLSLVVHSLAMPLMVSLLHTPRASPYICY